MGNAFSEVENASNIETADASNDKLLSPSSTPSEVSNEKEIKTETTDELGSSATINEVASEAFEELSIPQTSSRCSPSGESFDIINEQSSQLMNFANNDGQSKERTISAPLNDLEMRRAQSYTILDPESDDANDDLNTCGSSRNITQRQRRFSSTDGDEKNIINKQPIQHCSSVEVLHSEAVTPTVSASTSMVDNNVDGKTFTIPPNKCVKTSFTINNRNRASSCDELKSRDSFGSLLNKIHRKFSSQKQFDNKETKSGVCVSTHGDNFSSGSFIPRLGCSPNLPSRPKNCPKENLKNSSVIASKQRTNAMESEDVPEIIVTHYSVGTHLTVTSEENRETEPTLPPTPSEDIPPQTPNRNKSSRRQSVTILNTTNSPDLHNRWNNFVRNSRRYVRRNGLIIVTFMISTFALILLGVLIALFSS